MEGKTETSLIKLQGSYYNRIRYNYYSLIWDSILTKNTIMMSKHLWKERNRFVHTLLPNSAGVKKFNTIQSYNKFKLKPVIKGTKREIGNS